MLRLPNDSQLFGAVQHQTHNTSSPRDYFSATHWSVVINAGNSQSPRHESALEELCRRYWFPLYAYARHGGTAHADAEDLVQSFYSHFLKENYLRNLNGKNGRFRAFLLKCFQNHSHNERKRAGCQKRGGGADHLPLDWATADEKYQSQLMTVETPERAYDRAWAVTLLEQVLELLGEEMQAKGKGELFEELKPSLMVDRADFSYGDAANRLKLSEEATRQAAKRLRKRYEELIREEILKTCDPAEFEEEKRSLLNAFSD
jgi:RNA polymerase sigma-70 factor (ECF subfamily)